LGVALLLAGVCSLTTGCSKEEVQAAGDKAGAMTEDAKAKASEMKDQFATWMKDQQATLDQKLAQLEEKTSALSGDAAATKQQALSALEERVVKAKEMLAGWKDVSADKFTEYSAKAKDTVSKLIEDLQQAIDGNA
jgi:hypothetical protein